MKSVESLNYQNITANRDSFTAILMKKAERPKGFS